MALEDCVSLGDEVALGVPLKERDCVCVCVCEAVALSVLVCETV